MNHATANASVNKHDKGVQSHLMPGSDGQSAGFAVSVPPQPTALDLILNVLADAHSQTNRIESAINRAAGYGEEVGPSAPSPDALLERINIAVIDLRNRLETAAARLEGVA